MAARAVLNRERNAAFRGDPPEAVYRAIRQRLRTHGFERRTVQRDLRGKRLGQSDDHDDHGRGAHI